MLITAEEKQSRIDYVNRSYPNGLKERMWVTARSDDGPVLLKIVVDKDGKCIDLEPINEGKV